MDSMLLLAHVLECSMLMPAAVMALVPVRGWLRWPARMVAAATTATIATLVALGSWVSAAMRIPTNTYLFPSLVPLFFLYIALVDLPMRKKCFCFAVAMMLSAQATLLTIYIVAPAEVANATEAFMPSSALLCLLVSFSLVALFWRTLSWKLPMLFAMRSIDAIWGWLTLCPAGAFALALWLRPINFGLVTLGRSQQMMVVLCGLLIGFVWMICHLSWHIASHVDAEAGLTAENDVLRAEQRRYRDLRDWYDRDRTLRHDFRHHLLAIEGMARDGSVNELVDYVEELAGPAEGTVRLLSANPAVDAVASTLAAKAAEANVRVVWHLGISEHPFVSEVDICAVLGNLVENAIEAASRMAKTERWVEVACEEVTAGALAITCENPFEGDITFGRRGLPRSTSTGGGHGIGLSSVRAAAERHGGLMEVECDGGIFRVSVVMYGEPLETTETSEMAEARATRESPVA